MDQLQKLVSRGLKSQAIGPHPDADLLTAFAENALSARERTHLLGHLGTCSECRQILYFATQVSANAQPVLTFQPTLRSQVLRWGTLAASVVVITSALLINRSGLRTGSEESARPGQMSSAQTSPSRTNTNNEQGGPDVNQTAPKQLSRSQLAKEKIPPEIAEAQNTQNSWQGKTKSFPARMPEAKHMTARPQANLQFDQSGQIRLSPAPNPAQNQPASSSENVEITAAAPQAEPAKNGFQGEGRSVLSAVVLTPDLQWAVTQEGAIQRSIDSGKTWEMIPVAPGVVFRVVASVNTHVWAGGNAGALYHSADSGKSWNKIAPSAVDGAKLIQDIVHIQFSDPLTGHVSTVDGTTWTTSDGGQSWQMQ